MVNYANGKIYKIVCNITGKVYIGSTTVPLSRRLAEHRCNYKCWKEGKRNFITSFDIIKNGNYDIVLLEEFPCENNEQLYQRERFYIESLICVNKIIPTRTLKEYRIDNADKIREQKKIYCIDNADKIKEYKKIYRLDNADKIKECQKTYYIDNDDKLKEYQKKYRLDNPDKIKEKSKIYRLDNIEKKKEYDKIYRQKNAEKVKEYNHQNYLKRKAEKQQEEI